jgi:4-amino-4-deoxy-L-arabinose transferase-like glycosyltransferase
VLASSASIAALGKNEFSFLLPNLVALAAIVSAAYWLMRHHVGYRLAAMAVLLIGSTPVIVASATTLMPGLFETFFVLSSFALFFAATQSTRPTPWLVAAGIVAGLAFVTRETSVALLIFFFAAFLAGYRLPRLTYLWLVAGFLLVWFGEIAYIYSYTGDPLYRYIIDIVQYHPPSDHPLLAPDFHNPEEVQFARDRLAGLHDLPGGGGDSHPPGPVDFGTVLNPIAYLFINHEYGLLWVMGLPALVWGLLAKADSDPLAWVRPLSLLAIVWFLVISYGLGMRPIPRYYLVPVISIILIFTVLVYRTRSKVPFIGTMALSGILLVNILATDLRTPRALYERQFLNQPKFNEDVVHTRPDAAPLIEELAALTGKEVTLDVTPPQAGDLFLYIEKRYGRDTRVPTAFLPKASWLTVYAFPQRERILGRLIRLTPAAAFVPSSLLHQLRFPEPPAKLLRVQDNETP